MGLDWREMGWPEYQMTLAGWNASHEPEGAAPEPDLDRLRRFTAAHATMQ